MKVSKNTSRSRERATWGYRAFSEISQLSSLVLPGVCRDSLTFIKVLSHVPTVANSPFYLASIVNHTKPGGKSWGQLHFCQLVALDLCKFPTTANLSWIVFFCCWDSLCFAEVKLSCISLSTLKCWLFGIDRLLHQYEFLCPISYRNFSVLFFFWW